MAIEATASSATLKVDGKPANIILPPAGVYAR